jgi:hypothetical protein
MKANYEEATAEEIAVLCNGCGPQNMAWLRPFIPQLVFEESGNRHDWDYWEGGGREAYWRANFRFLANCLLSVANNSPWHKVPFHLVMAGVYYLAVKFGGSASFHWGEPRTQEQMHLLAVGINVRRIEADLSREK